jgi:hypothetical protein
MPPLPHLETTMTTTYQTTAIESLRTFATAHGELQFAHLCTAALADLASDDSEAWAVERLVTSGFSRWTSRCSSAWTIAAIRSTDTTRHDSAIARSIAL